VDVNGSFGYTGTLNYISNSGFMQVSSGASGNWNLSLRSSGGGSDSASWSAGMTSITTYPEEYGFNLTTTGTWGDSSGSLDYTLQWLVSHHNGHFYRQCNRNWGGGSGTGYGRFSSVQLR
jgi:hypothetical protein